MDGYKCHRFKRLYVSASLPESLGLSSSASLSSKLALSLLIDGCYSSKQASQCFFSSTNHKHSLARPSQTASSWSAARTERRKGESAFAGVSFSITIEDVVRNIRCPSWVSGHLTRWNHFMQIRILPLLVCTITGEYNSILCTNTHNKSHSIFHWLLV